MPCETNANHFTTSNKTFTYWKLSKPPPEPRERSELLPCNRVFALWIFDYRNDRTDTTFTITPGHPVSNR